MSDEYLWDGSGTPGEADQDIVRLERALGRLRRPLPPLAVGEIAHSEFRIKNSKFLIPNSQFLIPSRRSYVGARFLVPALAAAAAIVLMVVATWRGTAPRAWDVARVSGAPRIGSTPLADTGRIAVGETLATDAASRARMDVSTIGQVTVDTDTRVRLVDTRKGRHQLALERGTLHAFITAPPGQFVVNTPSSTATDLGCVYTLHVDEDGTGLLSVVAGWVAFEHNGRESFVPAGASSRTDPDVGPGTPRYDDTDEAFKAALDMLDYGDDNNAKKGYVDARARKADALTFVLTHARARDAMTLWHLISRVSESERGMVIDALAARAPMPSGVTRDAVMRLDRTALDVWWDTLGLRDAGWWRKWKRDKIW